MIFRKKQLSVSLKLLLPLLCCSHSSLLFSSPFLEDANVAPQAVHSCIDETGINPMSQQIELHKTDIDGPLPFIRSYSTALSLTEGNYNQANITLMDKEIRELGVGWTHNYAYKLEEGVSTSFSSIAPAVRVFLPEEGHYIYFLYDSKNRSFQRSSGAPYWGVVKDQEVTLRESTPQQLVLNYKGRKINFMFERGKGYFVQKVIYPDQKILNFSHVYSSKYNRWLLTKVEDNRGNTLNFQRSDLDGKGTAPQLKHYKGVITGVTTNNPKQNQTVEYKYQVDKVVWPAFFYYDGSYDKAFTLSQYPNLVTAQSSSNPREDYKYITYSKPAIRSNVQFPILSEYREQNILKRTWEYTNLSIISKIPGLQNQEAGIQVDNSNSQNKISIFKKLNSSLEQRDTYVRDLNLTNSSVGNVPATLYQADERYAQYRSQNQTSCLSYNNLPIKNLVIANSIRQISSVIDQNNNRTDFRYDANNRLLEKIEAKGTPLERKTILTYASNFWVPNEIKRGNLTQKNILSSSGQILQSIQSSNQKDSIDKTTNYKYQDNGLLNMVDGPRLGTLDQITYTYDSFGNKASESQVVNGVNRITQYLDYNSYGKPAKIIYPNGLIEQFKYNTDGRIAEKIVSSENDKSTLQKKTIYTYDEFKRLKSEKNANNELITYEYDLKDQLVSTGLPDGSKILKSFYGNGSVELEKKTDFSGNYIFSQTSNLINKFGLPIFTQKGNVANWYSIKKDYDANGNVIKTISADGLIQQWTYNNFNQITSHTDGMRNTVKKNYDQQNNIISSLDALNSGTNPYIYKNGGVLSQEINSDYGIKKYFHDEGDILKQSIHVERKCDYLKTDALERVSQRICSNTTNVQDKNLVHNFNYEYDKSKFGQLDAVNSNDKIYGVSTSYKYDNFGNITEKNQINHAINTWKGKGTQLSVQYVYNLGNHLSLIKMPSGRVINFNYDRSKSTQIKNISINNIPLLKNLRYGAAGELLGWNWGETQANYEQAYDHSKNGLIKSIVNKDQNNNILYSLIYDYDKDNRIAKITRNNNTHDVFSYDKADRLIKENRRDHINSIYEINYSYDKNGNRLTLKATGAHQQPNAQVNYIYKGNQLSSINNRSIKYTKNAELIDEKFTPIYDAAGNRRLDTQVTNSNVQYYMSYNHNNARTIRAYSENKGAVQKNIIQYMYDEKNHLIGEYDENGKPLVEYIWLEDKPIVAFYGIDSKPYWILTDSQNTPRRLIDSVNQATVWAWDSTAFGTNVPSIQKVKFNLRFPGQYYDELTKQHYNLNRFYLPELGRYVEPDRIGLEGGNNPYLYAEANPVNNYDDDGMSPRGGRIIALRPVSDPLITAHVLRLEQEIRIHNPNYRYNVMVPAGQPTFTGRDVLFLQQELSRYTGSASLRPLGGASRSQEYSQNWQPASLSLAVRRMAGENPHISISPNFQKTQFRNRDTGIEILFDLSGNYFRVRNPNINSGRQFSGLNGENMNNKVLPNGKQMGRSKPEYNEATHFYALP